jgi:hypothetical protein
MSTINEKIKAEADLGEPLVSNLRSLKTDFCMGSSSEALESMGDTRAQNVLESLAEPKHFPNVSGVSASSPVGMEVDRIRD